MHGFDLEDSVDACGVISDRSLVVFTVRSDKGLEMARVARVSMHRFLSDEFNYIRENRVRKEVSLVTYGSLGSGRSR